MGLHAVDVKYVGTPGLSLLVPEYWISSWHLQHGGPCLWSLSFWTLSHLHLFFLWGESVLDLPFCPFFAPFCPDGPFNLISFPKCSLFSYSLLSPSSSLVSCQTVDNYQIPNNNNNQWRGRPVSEWNNQQVCLWLIAMNMDQYTSEFAAKGIDGTQLLNMDSQKLKVSKILIYKSIQILICNISYN